MSKSADTKKNNPKAVSKSGGDSARLTLKDKALDLNVLHATMGPDVIDIQNLYGKSGCFTFDPGFTSTASCESKITFIDGNEGMLLYRGYPIEQLAEYGDYLETCYLLLYGDLPTQAERRKFDQSITHHTMVQEQMSIFFRGFRRDAHPHGHHGGRRWRSVGFLS